MAIYLIKINVALMLLYGFYRLTVSRDTFFGLRRLTLWLIYAVALMVPALNLEYWVRDTPTMASMANVYADTFYPVVVVKAQAPSITWIDMLLGIYWAGVAVLSLRLVWQLFSIIRLAAISRKQEVEGITVHLLRGEGSPFSFFRWVFMYPSTLEGKQLHEVMVHECTHVSGLHSLDTLFSELFSIACWFNPFAWLMKQEVRMNLEYLADESVLSDGNARKSYQYHLLGLAYRQPNESTKIANNFNLSSNPQPIGFSGILLAKRQNSFYCTYFLHNRNVADTKSPYPIKRLEVIRWFNQKSMVFNQSPS